MLPAVLRTYQSLRFSGVMRNGASACRYTFLIRLSVSRKLFTYADAHAIEGQAVQLLKKAPKLAGAEALASAFEEHLKETERHRELIEQRLEARGGSPSSLKDAALRAEEYARGMVTGGGTLFAALARLMRWNGRLLPIGFACGRWGVISPVVLTLKNISIVLCLLMTIWTVNDFDTPWLLTQGGPASATENLVLLAYRYTFGRNNVGLGSAVSFVTLLILMVFVILLLRRQRER